MTGQPSPLSLWLACGLCARAPNLARVTPAGCEATPRLAASPPLPGDEYVVRGRAGVRYRMYPRTGSTGFVHVFSCPSCQRTLKVSDRRLAGWWDALAASGRARDTMQLGRDRLRAIPDGTPYAVLNCMGCPGDHARIMLRGSGHSLNPGRIGPGEAAPRCPRNPPSGAAWSPP
jgi:hypothetical protein